MEFYPTVSRGEWGPYMSCETVLISAASFANYEVINYGSVREKIFVPGKKPSLKRIAFDPGGYVATRKWLDYRFTKDQYVQWLWNINNQYSDLEGDPITEWAATFDYCCESDIASDVEERIKRTVDNAYHMIDQYSDVPWCWVPTIQGRELDQYLDCAEQLYPLIQQQLQQHDSRFRVGIGTLCRRNSGKEIAHLIHEITSRYPDVPFHLWGVKLEAFEYLHKYFPDGLPANLKSCDSAAWNGMYGRNRDKWKLAGKKQRQWCFENALPDYRQKLAKYAIV